MPELSRRNLIRRAAAAKRGRLPYHCALAGAYTIGDAYHCSVLSATGPNRTYLWSGTINADQRHGSYAASSGASPAVHGHPGVSAPARTRGPAETLGARPGPHPA